MTSTQRLPQNTSGFLAVEYHYRIIVPALVSGDMLGF